MEPFTTYKMLPKQKRELFKPPPYCRKADKHVKIVDEAPIIKLDATNPVKILHLLESLSDNSSKALEMKINKYLKGESESSSVFLVNVSLTSEEALIQVVDEKQLKNAKRVNLPDESLDKIVQYMDSYMKYGENLEAQIQTVIDSILPNDNSEKDIICVPVCNRGRRNSLRPNKTIFPILITCFLNSSCEKTHLVTLVQECFRFCLTILINTMESEEEARLKRQCQSLLTVARKLFSHLVDLDDLLKEIMLEARKLTNAERCSLFLLDMETSDLVAKVFDGVSSNEAKAEVRIAKDQGIAGHVCATGEILNIKDAYEHPLFYKGMDETTGFKTRNILCFPIRNEDGIVGVAELCNKKSGGNFDYFDEEVANAFSIYCGLSIVHSLMYKKINDAQARNKLSNELMMYHMKVSEDAVTKVLKCPGVHVHPYLDKLYFSPRDIDLDESVCFVLKMIQDLNFLEEFSIRKELLVRFILYVQRGYRDTPYHNWTHAFSTAHFAYLCIKNFKLIEKQYLTELEAFAYFISGLCHDIDHRGTTNAFQHEVNSTLASLYSSEGSVMERHHLSQTLCILNTEGCNFLESLSGDDYKHCLDCIKDMILATDLANHFKLYRKQLIMVQEGYRKDDEDHKFALMSLLMTAADLSDQTKNWSVVKTVAKCVYQEFFNQGDLEKQMGKDPSNMMDREKASIPELQIVFISQVCLPCFQLLTILFPSAKIMVDTMKKNMNCWESSKKVFERYNLEGKLSLEALESASMDQEVLGTVDN